MGRPLLVRRDAHRSRRNMTATTPTRSKTAPQARRSRIVARPLAEPPTSSRPGAQTSADHGLPLPRRGVLERDWQKALVVLLTLLAGLALLWVLWQVLSP